MTKHELEDRIVRFASQSDNALLVTGNAKHFPQAPFIITPADFAAQFC